VDAWGDAHGLAQVLTNLIGNAVKFSPRGAAVAVTAEVLGGSVRVTVRDQGRGIPADKLGSVFERFEQVEVRDAKEKGGAGLGLAICRAIVEQHGGRIWAESAGAGCGSAFHFTLPTADRGLAELRTPA
jgi:signal transduction histidine kinase